MIMSKYLKLLLKYFSLFYIFYFIAFNVAYYFIDESKTFSGAVYVMSALGSFFSSTPMVSKEFFKGR